MANHNEDLKPVHQRFAKSLVCLAVLGTIGSAFAAEVAVEQENPNTLEQPKVLSQEGDDIEVIQVKGIRASMAQNLAEKRMAGAVVDAITAEDIGKFPDKNVADSLQRVPGVVIQRDGGEGARVSIRGLASDLTYTQLNGNFIASSPGEPSRSFDYSLLPSAMIERLEVFKSPEARLDAGGVGGTVILHSRKPLAMDSGSGVLNVEYTYADVTEEYEPNATALYSWKNDDEDFGLLLGVTQQKRTNRTLSSSANSWRYATSDSAADPGRDVNGNPVDNSRHWGTIEDATGTVHDGQWFPQYVRMGMTDEDRKRTGIQFSTQWRPTDRIELGFNYFHFKLEQDRTFSVVDMPEWHLNPSYLTNVGLDDSGTIIRSMDFVAGADGQYNDMQFPWMRGTFTKEESTSDTFDFNATYEGDDFTVKFVGGHTESEGGPTENWEAAYKTSNWGEGDYLVENASNYAGWAFTGDSMNFYMDPNTINNLKAGVGGGRDPGSSGSSFVQSELEENYAQLDFEFYVDYSIFTTLKTGVKYRDAEQHRQTFNNFFVPDGDNPDTDGNGEVDQFDSYQWLGGMPDAADVINAKSEGNIAGSFNTNLFPTINWNEYRNIVTSEYDPYTRQEENFVYDIEEKIYAFYVQGDFEFLDDFRGNIGVRVEKTESTVTSTDQVVYQWDHDDGEGNRIVGDAGFEDVFQPITRDNDYTEVLPSLNLIWDAGEDWVVRGAIAKVMSRPDYGDLGAQENLTYTSAEWASDRSEFGEEEGWQGGGGNKALDPFEAWQADLSLEYYYKEGSAAGVAIFNKEVENFVVPMVVDSTRPFDGYQSDYGSVPAGNITVTPFSTVANGSEATSRGFEFFLQHAFDNGFGINTNYTYNDSSESDVIDGNTGEKVGKSPLIGSADYQFNASIYYENDDFSVRSSYNKRGEMVLGQQNGMNAYADPYDQVDVNFSYNILEDLTFTASAINVTKSEEVTRLGKDTNSRFLSNTYSGRRYYAGLTYSF